MMHIETFCLGDWQTNCYVLHHQDSRRCWIVDAGFEPVALVDYIRKRDLDPVQVILTHAHVDHIAGLADLRSVWPELPILIHEAESSFLKEPALNLSVSLPYPVVAPEATGTLVHGQQVDVDKGSLEIRHTPGHSPGGISLYHPAEEITLVGDALFAGSIGRTDFPTSNHNALMEAIHQQLLTLPDTTRVLAGHGDATTIGRERQFNPFLRS